MALSSLLATHASPAAATAAAPRDRSYHWAAIRCRQRPLPVIQPRTTRAAQTRPSGPIPTAYTMGSATSTQASMTAVSTGTYGAGPGGRPPGTPPGRGGPTPPTPPPGAAQATGKQVRQSGGEGA